MSDSDLEVSDNELQDHRTGYERFKDRVYQHGDHDVQEAAMDAESEALADIIADWHLHFFVCHRPAQLMTPDAVNCCNYAQFDDENPFACLYPEVSFAGTVSFLAC